MTANSLVGVQEMIWQRREERMQRIVAAWEDRCCRRPPDPPPLKTLDRKEWPSQFPSRRRPCVLNDVLEVGNGRASGLADLCRGRPEDLFWLIDLGCIDALYRNFIEQMPRVRPYFAVKCFPDPRVVRRLEQLGCGFDCASAPEIDLVGSNDIIVANPCKRQCDIEAIERRRITYTTFDCAEELKKLVRLARCKPILRIRADDPDSRLPFGAKYGATEDEIPALFQAARQLGLTIAGIAFHVGSGARTAGAYRAAIQVARNWFSKDMTVLDIGGGFCGDFDQEGNARLSAAGDTSLSMVINQALDDFFPVSEWPELTIIAEPGRYFAESAASLCARVISSRLRAKHREFWISDGVYGAFNAILYDAWLPHAVVLPTSARRLDGGREADTLTTVFGPTCDSLDIVFNKVPNAPHIELGDLLLFPNCGAYTLAGATDFNGIPSTKAPRLYIASKSMQLSKEDAHEQLLYSDKPPMEVVRYFH